MKLTALQYFAGKDNVRSLSIHIACVGRALTKCDLFCFPAIAFEVADFANDGILTLKQSTPDREHTKSSVDYTLPESAQQQIN